MSDTTLPANVDPDTMRLLNDDGSPVVDESTGEIIVWEPGMPTSPAFYNLAVPPVFDTTYCFIAYNAAVRTPQVDQSGNYAGIDGEVPTILTTQDVFTFVRKANITAEEAREFYLTKTSEGGMWPDATQTPYKPSLYQLSLHWRSGLGRIYYPD